jgi:hypothetical protein
MAVWADFYPRVMPYVLGCPVPTVDTALIDAAREFCTSAAVWVVEPTLTIASVQSLHDFPLVAGEELVKVAKYTVNGKEFTDIKTVRDLPDDWRTNPPTTQSFYQKSATEFLIFPAPALTDVVVLELVLRPTLDAAEIDDATFAEHGKAIAQGAKAELQRMPRQPWTDLTQAQIDGLAFEAEIHSAANKGWRYTAHKRVTKQVL